MENQEILDSGLSARSELSLNSAAIDYLRQTAKWGKFLSIVGLVFSGLIIVLGLAFGTFLSAIMAMSPNANMASEAGLGASKMVTAGVGIFYSIMGLIMAYPPLRLLQFSKQAKIAVDTNDGNAIENALKRLRSVFRFYGIFTIIILSFYALALVIVLLVGGLAAFK